MNDKPKLSIGLVLFGLVVALAVKLLGWFLFLWFTVNCLQYLGVL